MERDMKKKYKKIIIFFLTFDYFFIKLVENLKQNLGRYSQLGLWCYSK